MEDDRNQVVAGIKAQVERDEYIVDSYAVADALLKRLRGLAESRPRYGGTDEPGPRYRECSYPASSPSGESVNRRPGSPGTTRPTQVNPGPSAWSRKANSALAREFWGRQAHSS